MQILPSSLDGPSLSGRTISDDVNSSFAVATRWFAIGGAVLCLSLLAWFPSATILIAAIMFGYSEANGACGVSHIGSFTPLRARSAALWTRAVLAYTICGALTASLVGAVVGQLGLLAQTHAYPTISSSVILVISIALVLQEIRWVSFPLPQIRRQTNKMWAEQFGWITGAAMWGAHIGLTLFTVVKHGGLYVLVAIALVAKPHFSAAIFLAYWLGRTLPIWAMPMFIGEWRDGRVPSSIVLEAHVELRYLTIAGLLVVAYATILMAGYA